MPRIVVINASLAGAQGNTMRLAGRACLRLELQHRCEVDLVTLANSQPHQVIERLRLADGIVLATGTYWDSWSSLLQRFLEESTTWEGSDVWLGKPVAVIVTEHSVGGKGVLSRLQGVMSTLGCTVPPMSGLVYSMAGHLALKSGAAIPQRCELWCPDDVDVVCHNLAEAVQGGSSWRTWSVGCGEPAAAPWYAECDAPVSALPSKQVKP